MAIKKRKRAIKITENIFNKNNISEKESLQYRHETIDETELEIVIQTQIEAKQQYLKHF